MPAILNIAEHELHWIALHLVPGLGARRLNQLLDGFGSPEAALRAQRSELEAAGLSGSLAQTIASGCTFEDAVEQQQRMKDSGTVLITRQSPEFPERLKQIYDPPVILYARGRVDLLQSVMIAVVGTRRPTPYGVAAAERFSADLAAANVTVVSGMARGIDTAAHRAALTAEGNTVAVLGNGVDMVYPAENRKLAAEIATKGLLLSEFPMGSPSYPQNFPVRNRIVSGMSSGVLVVEGAQYSGSAITARLAMEQGREVFAVPGNVTSRMSWGPNLLIKQGAKLAQEWTNIVDELTPEERRKLIVRSQPELVAEDQSEGESRPQSAVEKQVLSILQQDSPKHLDTLVESLEGFSASELITALFELELAGKVRQLPGRTFLKVW